MRISLRLTHKNAEYSNIRAHQIEPGMLIVERSAEQLDFFSKTSIGEPIKINLLGPEELKGKWIYNGEMSPDIFIQGFVFTEDKAMDVEFKNTGPKIHTVVRGM